MAKAGVKIDVDVRLDLKLGPDIIEHELNEAASRGLYLAAEHVLTEAGPRTPWREGHLEKSGDPRERPGAVAVDNGRLEAALGYDIAYAARQHEEMDWQHLIKGEPKWLERTLRAEASTVHKIIGTQLERALRG
ncbi:hypothetical protein SAMN05421874_12825 [Nonomuraea maritima]|uniref:Uncharacterized protein n=2 Tax=Nonomuraea maritima TaxID=683260 RepID=A0A1G9MFZ6_9ACTN|nr:hypothetical protein SAMN05421874_12825 [Nonomuraea maritima]